MHGFTLSPATAGEHYTLSGYPSVLNRVGSLIRYQVPGGDAIGFAALDTPYWRNPLAVRFGTDAEGAPRVALPLRMYEQTWIRDGFGGVSPNYTGLTLGVPANTVRRAYGIVLSPAVDETQARLASLFALAGQLGAMPLDRVKEWVLDWPDPMAGQTWAEASTPDGRKALDILRNKIAIKRAYGNFAIFSMAYHYDYAKAGYPPIAKVINDPTQLSADDRRELRRLCAFYAYDMNSLDTFPYGMGFHLNNPNMTIMAVEARVKASAVIRDHPQFRPWGEESRALMQDYFRRFTKDSGAPYENPHYTLGVTLEWAAVANDLLMENGLGDALDMELFRRTMRFVPNWLTPPDPRFNGHRVVLPIGNGSYQSVPGEFTRRFVNYYKERDPPLAGVLQWYGNQTVPADKQCQLVEEVVPALRSEWVKDYGVFFRHGFGTPYETLMHLLAGTCFGHNEHETDQMAYTIYAKGQPIHLSFGNGYFPIYNRPWLRNRISFDMKMEVPERYRIAVVSAAFSPALDYFRAVREFAQLVPRGEEYPVLDDKNQWTPRESADFARSCELWDQPPSFIPPTVWHRQMMLLKDADPKGPTYFVLRDSFAGKPTVPTDLNLWFLANSMETRGGVYHFDGQCEVDMDVFVAAPQTFTPHTAKYGHQQQPYRRDTGFDPKYHPDGKLGETQLLLRVRQPPGAGYLVVLYPRLKAGDPEAAFVRLADNAVQVTTPVARDVVFLDSVPFTCRTPEVSFTGRAGAVRFHPDGRTVIVNSEGPGEFAVAGRSVVGTGAFEVVIEGGKATSRTLTDGAAVEVR
ncbi:MAG: hypothetical protein BWZ02_02659 [Lentisphaerae bacterium ADurb.BinA184]|nr:MAG: hypothetical protein BWZ02_02659 [Lentisphaerae bacterium ADurb.BinA184]